VGVQLNFRSTERGKICPGFTARILDSAKKIVENWPELGHNIFVAYRVVFTENAVDDFKALNARWRAMVRDSIRVFLTNEPTRQSRSRIKKLRDLRHPQFRLRVGEIRVFYDVAETDVVIIAIMTKEKAIEWLKEQGIR
jgi:mRNA interferase RelE/StbE